jgi:iron complex outermembrane receptor protein
VDFVPEPPKNDRNFSQKWAYSNIENEFGMWRSEYDITDNWTAYTGLGAQHAHEEGIYSAPKLLDKSGKATVSRLDTNRISDSVSGMAGIRGNFNTGFVSHKVNVGYSAMTKNEKIAWKMSATKDNPTTNIYHNTGVDMPDSTNFNGSGGKYSDPLTSGRTRTQGWLLSDTLGVLDDKLLFTAGRAIRKWSFAGITKLPVRKTTRTASTAAAGCQPTAWFTNRGRRFPFTPTTPKRCSRAKPRLTPPPTTARAPVSFTLSRTKWA